MLPDTIKNIGRPVFLQTLNYAKTGQDTVDADRLGLRRYKGILLAGDVTITKAGAAAFGTVVPESPFTIISEVLWKDRETTKQLPARILREIAHKMLRGIDTDFTAPTATNTVEQLKFELMLDHEALRTDQPERTLADLSPGFEAPELTLKFGSEEDLINGGDYTTKSVTGTVKVYGLLDEKRFLNQAMFDTSHLRFIEKPVNAVSTTVDIDIERGHALRFLHVGQYTKNPFTPLANTLVSVDKQISVEVNDEVVWGPFELQRLQRQNTADYRLAQGTGYFVVDFTRSKKWDEMLDATKSLDPNAPDRVNSVRLRIQSESVANAFLGVTVASVEVNRLRAAA